MAQLTAIRTSVRYRLGVPSSDSFFTDAVVTELINEALDWYSVQGDWRWLEKLDAQAYTGSDNVEDLPADYSATVLVTNTSGEPLMEKPWAEFAYLSDGTESANPRVYSVWSGAVYLYPTPSGSLTINHYYRAAETALSGDTDTPLIPDQWLGCVYEYAAGLGAQRQGNMAEAEVKFKTANAWIDRMKSVGSVASTNEGGGERPRGES